MTAVIISASICVALLFISMVLSSMAASDAKKNNLRDAHKWSTWAAVVNVITIAVVVIMVVLHLNSGRIAKGAYNALGGAQRQINPFM